MPRRAAGLPVKVNAVIKRGANDDQIVPMAAFFREQGHTLRFIEYMDVGHTNGWRLDDVVPAAEIVGALDGAFGVEPVDAGYRGEVAKRWRYTDGRRRDRRDRLRHAAVLRRLHARPPVGGRKALHLPVRGPGARPAGADSGRRHRRGARRRHCANVWNSRKDRYSELRSEATESLPKVEMSYIGG